MPQAPQGLLPDVSPSGQGTPDISLPVPTEAFGGAVGQALQTLGGDITKSSDTIWSRAMEMQGLANETAAKDADAKYMMQSGVMHAKFINLEGQNASPEALAKHIQDLQDLRTNLRQGLNPAAARMYDGSSLSFMARNIFNAAGHAGQQQNVAANQADQSRIQAIDNHIGDNPQDEIAFKRGIAAKSAAIEDMGSRSGWSPQKVDETKQESISTSYAHRIEGIAKTNAIAAQRMLDSGTKDGSITDNDSLKLQATINTRFRDQGSRIITDQVLANRRDGKERDQPEQYYIDKAEAQADQTMKDNNITDPFFKDAVRKTIQTQFGHQMTVERSQEFQDKQTLTNALQHTNAEGFHPRSVDELKSVDPATSAAWDRMQPTDQDRFRGILRDIAAGKRIEPTDENQKRYTTLLGMAGPTGDRNAFMNTDIWKENIPLAQRNQLLSLQRSAVLQSAQDPRVGHAIGILKQDASFAGIDKKQDADSYYNFTGALQGALAQFQDNTKRAPNDKEIKEIGNHLIQEQTANTWFGGAFGGEPLYNISVPSEDVDRITKDKYWEQHNMRPSPQMIHNYYVREQYNKLFKGSASAGEESIVSGTSTRPSAE